MTRLVTAWRKRAAEVLPELWLDESSRETPNLFFFELLPFVRDAHRAGDDEVLARAYGFARWCLDQGGELENAAGVSFYEHLFDSWDIHESVARWLDPVVVAACWPLFEHRLSDENVAVLRQKLGGHR